MRVSLFFSDLAGGGTQRRMLTLARGLLERGDPVEIVVASGSGPFRAAVPRGAPVVPLGNPWRRVPGLAWRRGLWVPLSAPTLAARLRAAPPDVLLASSTPANLAAVRAVAASGASVPLALVLNLPVSAITARLPAGGGLLRRLLARAYRRADALVAISAGVAEDASRTLGLDRERIEVIPNPVDLAAIGAAAAAPLQDPWLVPDAPPVLLAVGKLRPQKDLPTLLTAFAELRRRRPARLVILGEGPERARLEEMARRLGVEADLRLPGFEPNPFAWMARASLFILSSRFEGFSNVLAEALACGCRIVATDCPHGPRELLLGGRLGRLVPPGDAPALAAAMAAALDAPHDPSAGPARVAKLSVERAVDAYRAVLARIAGVAPVALPRVA